MELIGIIFLLIIGFVILGISGWIFEFISCVIEFLFDGIGHLFSNTIGCLVWIFVIMFVLMCLATIL